ncbi:acyl-[acyl-carrier-protein] thioesterase [Treponema sp.]|uniref:acyl-[acyl-carrier-protein] thioesterase n=1 Tax=Treponema sp. TaxID=166 RepID=UPI00388F46EA
MENNLIFTQERNISSAFIDSSLKMGIAQSVLMVQDNLTECFNMLGCDGVIYREKYNAFWVFTKSKLIFEKRPYWRDKISASTFPVDNAGFKAHINTILKDKNGNTLIRANQEACVLDLEKHRPVKLTNLNYPKENFPESVFNEPFEKLDTDFTEEDFKYEQIIRSQQIDMSHHLNNIEYIKFALNVFTDDFLLSHEVKSLEVHYTGESKEGQILKIYSKTNTDTTQIVIKESDRTVFEMKIEFYN